MRLGEWSRSADFSMILTPQAHADKNAPAIGRRVFLLLVAVAIAARVATFGNPIIQVDEEFYLLVARRMLHGALPYVDIWDRKPIGLFLIYLLPATLPPAAAVYAYQAMALASVVATALLIARLAQWAGWERGGTAAAVFYILWLDLGDGQGGQAPVFYNLLVALALWAALCSRPSRRQGSAAMLIFGIALQVKYTVLFEGVATGVWLLWQDYRATRAWRATARYALMLCAFTLVPTASVAAFYTAGGHADDFFYANFLSVFRRHPDVAAWQRDNAINAAAILGPLVAMAVAGAAIGKPAADAHQRDRRICLYVWLASSVAGFVAFGGWFNHYTLPVMLPGAVCSASLLSECRVRRYFVPPAVPILFLVGQTIVHAAEEHRGTPAQFDAIVRSIGQAPGTLYVDWGEPAFYTFSGRRPLSRYAFPTHLQIAREAGAIGVNQSTEIARIFSRRPDVVVLMGPPKSTFEDPRIRQEVADLVRQGGYDRPIRLPLGRLEAGIYHRLSYVAPEQTLAPARVRS